MSLALQSIPGHCNSSPSPQKMACKTYSKLTCNEDLFCLFRLSIVLWKYHNSPLHCKVFGGDDHGTGLTLRDWLFSLGLSIRSFLPAVSKKEKLPGVQMSIFFMYWWLSSTRRPPKMHIGSSIISIVDHNAQQVRVYMELLLVSTSSQLFLHVK